jgi:putative FmdB family regulatory protein
VPTYSYTCTACNEMIEKRQSFSDPPLTTCEQCGGALRKVIHPVGIVFKGSGWYITDSRASSSSANGRSSSATSTSDSAKTTDSGSSPSKASSGSKDAPASKDSSASTTTKTEASSA